MVLSTRHGVKYLVPDISETCINEEKFYKLGALCELPTKVYEHTILKSLKLFWCTFLKDELIRLHALKKVSFGDGIEKWCNQNVVIQLQDDWEFKLEKMLGEG